MPILKNFQNHIENQLPFLKESKLIIAISGGVDSVVLAHLCAQLKLDFALAHCNFKLRRVESDKDEAFVKSLSENLGIEYHVTHFNTEDYISKNKEIKESIDLIEEVESYAVSEKEREAYFYPKEEKFCFAICCR